MQSEHLNCHMYQISRSRTLTCRLFQNVAPSCAVLGTQALDLSSRDTETVATDEPAFKRECLKATCETVQGNTHIKH